MKKLLSFLFLLPNLTFAGVSVGGEYGNFKGLTVGDYNLFDQVTEKRGVVRYGGGTSRFQFGNGIGLHLVSNTGTFLNKQPSDVLIMPRIALETFTGSLVLNSNSYVESYYQYLPAVAIGPQLTILENKIFVAFKAGGSISNFGKDGILPNFHNAFGISLFFNNNLALNAVNIGDNYIRNIEVQNNNFCIKVEDKRGSLRDTSILLFLKISQ